jgi:hypothetical protein
LGHQRGGAEREHCDGKRGTDHFCCSLCGLIPRRSARLDVRTA